MELLNQTLARISPVDPAMTAAAREHISQLTMPHWALGRLLDLAVDLAGITGILRPKFSKKAVVVMAADHGVADEGVSKYPKEVTAQMVANFVHGGAGINALAAQAGADVHVVDMGIAAGVEDLVRSGAIRSMPVGPGTRNMTQGPAMTREEAIQSLESGIRVGIELMEKDGYDLIGVGEMGIGNTTPSAAIIAVLTGEAPKDVTGHGTGIDDVQIAAKIRIIEKALQVNRPDPKDPVDVLAKVGGFEIGGIAGVILAAAALKKPVLVDGLITTAAALIAYELAPASSDYMIASHKSVEKGHMVALRRLGKDPLLDLSLRLGEATGAALAMNLVEASSSILARMKTFAEAGVSGGAA